MPNCPIQREFKIGQLEWVMSHTLFAQMTNGIARGKILPALRKSEVDFYEGGARLFHFTTSKIFSHPSYIGREGRKEIEIEDPESINVFCLRKRAVRHRRKKQADSELAAVHTLFRHFAITRTAHQPDEIALIDIEAFFLEGVGTQPKLPRRMIDLVFLLPNRQLLFVEAKCVGNPEVVSTTTAKVVEQVHDCERHIAREGVRDAFNRSLEMQSFLVRRNLGQAKGIFPRVPVLILDPTKKGISPRSKDKWLKTALARSEQAEPISSDAIVINGMNDPVAAIRGFVERLRP